jgi:hypothetical protein
MENVDDSLPPSEVDEAELRAIQEGLNAMEAGQVCDFDEFDREFRMRNGIAMDS